MKYKLITTGLIAGASCYLVVTPWLMMLLIKTVARK